MYKETLMGSYLLFITSREPMRCAW